MNLARIQSNARDRKIQPAAAPDNPIQCGTSTEKGRTLGRERARLNWKWLALGLIDLPLTFFLFLSLVTVARDSTGLATTLTHATGSPALPPAGNVSGWNATGSATVFPMLPFSSDLLSESHLSETWLGLSAVLQMTGTKSLSMAACPSLWNLSSLSFDHPNPGGG